MNPTPPEIWLLPYASWSGIGLAHPGRFWCHCRMVSLPSVAHLSSIGHQIALFLLLILLLSCHAACCSFKQHLAYPPLHGSATLSPRGMSMRGNHVLSSACIAQVYLPMSYVYGARGTGKLTPLVLSLRKELYATSYDSVDWNTARNQCAPTDLYYPHPKIQDILWWTLYKAEGLLLGSGFRKKALAEVMRHVHYEVCPCRLAPLKQHIVPRIERLGCLLDLLHDFACSRNGSSQQ